jgi:hypothetical protein
MTADNIPHAGQLWLSWKLLADLRQWVDDISRRKRSRVSAFVLGAYGLLYSGLRPYRSHLHVFTLSGYE